MKKSTALLCLALLLGLAGGAFFFERIRSFVHGNREDINAISTLVIAVFTAILGYFTVRLAGSTRLAAEAASKSAKADIGIRLPIIRIRPDSLVHGETGDGEDVSVYQVWLHNLGATKAFPIEILYGFTIGGTLPEKPDYKHLAQFPINEIVEPDPESVHAIRLLTGEPLKSEDWEKICKGNYLWFYCELHYRDFMDELRTHGFCFRWAHAGIGCNWRPDKTSAYNQKT